MFLLLVVLHVHGYLTENVMRKCAMSPLHPGALCQFTKPERGLCYQKKLSNFCGSGAAACCRHVKVRPNCKKSAAFYCETLHQVISLTPVVLDVVMRVLTPTEKLAFCAP